MKVRNVFLYIIAALFSLPAISQVSVSNDGALPDQSAMLDIKSSDKGILIPRVSITSLTSAVTPVSNPARGLLVYNMNSPYNEGFYVWDGDSWSALASTDYVNNITNSLGIVAFGEMYQFHNVGSYTSVTLSSSGGWFPWNTGITGDTNLVNSSVAGGSKRFNIEVGGSYEIIFQSGVQAQMGGLVADAAIFKNGTVQNDLRGRSEFREGNSTQSLTFSGIIALLPGDYIDVRFSGNQNKDLRLETVSLVIRQLN